MMLAIANDKNYESFRGCGRQLLVKFCAEAALVRISEHKRQKPHTKLPTQHCRRAFKSLKEWRGENPGNRSSIVTILA